MATHGKDAKIYAGGFNLSAYFNSASISHSKDTAETSVFALDSKTYIEGMRDATFSGAGIFDGSTDAVDPELHSVLTSTAAYVVSYLPQGDTTGLVGYGLGNAITNNYSVEAPVSGVVTIGLDAQASGGANRYIVLHSLGAEDGGGTTGVSASYDFGSTSANGGVGFIHLTAMTTGVTAVDVTIQTSTEATHTVPSTNVTFTQITAAGAGERIAFTGTFNQHARASWTVTGGTTADNATFHVGLARL